LNLADVLVSIVFDIFIKSEEGIKFEFNLLLLLGQIKNKQFFNLELFFSFSSLSHGLRGCSGHLLSNSGEELNLNDELVFFFKILLHTVLE